MTATQSPLIAPRLITLGETMVMLTPGRGHSLAAAAELQVHVGGAESNVATHAAALGIDAAWVSAVGADVLGDRVRDAIAARGVDVTWVRTDSGAPTGVYFKDPGHGVLYYRAGSAASRMTPDAVAEVPLEAAEIVHISGITPALSPTCSDLVDTVIDRVGAGSGRLSFDVNHRAALWAPGEAAPTLLALARRADIVFVGLDEAQTVWGCETVEDVRELLPEPARLVVKDGDVGASEFATEGSQDSTTFVPAIPTEVVEPVGAGDAFAAGYLAAHLGGEDAAGRLSAGHARAHLVLRSTSDFVADNIQ
ncbi:sugar kinase [Microbacterium sp. KHB019]|uniref:sugar kinase n=1 Tax=Microbacterium sp. KHB019 TaxID=3129770 RepID=UPI0030791050